MKVRNGLFTKIDGSFYSVTELRSEVPVSDQDRLFIIKDFKYTGGNENGKVMGKDLEFLLLIKTYCRLKDIVLEVVGSKENGNLQLEVATRKSTDAESLGLRRMREGWYVATVGLENISEMWEVRERYKHFKLPPHLPPKKIVWTGS